MAYTTATLSLLSGLIQGGYNHWFYTTTDAIGTITGAGYFSDATSTGLGLGDIVWVIKTDTPSFYSVQVTAVSGAAATVTDTEGTLAASISATDLDLGASGTAGSLDIFPSTALSGRVRFTAADQAGDTILNIVNATQSGNRTYTVGDAGGNATFVMTAGTTQNIAGNVTASLALQGNTTVQAGKDASAGTVSIFPTTTASGHTNVTMTNNTGNTTTVLNFAAQAAARTYSFPDMLGNGTVAGTSGANLAVVDIYRAGSSLTKNANVTYADVPNLTGMAIGVGTYRFRVCLPSTVASGTGGIKYAFNYTTAVLSAIEATGIGYTASAVAVQHTTTTTTQTDIFTQAAVVIMTELVGTMTVSTAGTLAVQMAQNTSNASNTVTLTGSSAEFVRIA